MRKIILLCFIVLLVGCATEKKYSFPLITRVLANQADLKDSRDLNRSPYRKIIKIDYQKIAPLWLKYIEGLPSSVPFRNQEWRWAWAQEKAHSDQSHFKLLPFTSDTSTEPLFRNLDELKTQRPYLRIHNMLHTDKVKNKKPERLFAYQIFDQSPSGKSNILIWAKEHGDELSTSEFVSLMGEFFLYHLNGHGHQNLNQIVKDLFSNINLIVVPDMTPDKNFTTFKNRTSSPQDYNAFGVLLQPFDYDSDNPLDYVVAPEAAFLKNLILGLDNVALGLDIHLPFNTSVITFPDITVEKNNGYLIAEANAAACSTDTTTGSKSCDQSRITHPEISFGPANASSFLSRMKVAPSILIELNGPVATNQASECGLQFFDFKDHSCSYDFKYDMSKMVPYFLRLMEILSNTEEFTQTRLAENVDFLDKIQGQKTIRSRDSFLNNLSANDIKVRMGKEISKNEFTDFIGDQVLEWRKEEIFRIRKLLSFLEKKMGRLGLKLNLTRYKIIKTTGKEEGGLPYTRGPFIFLPESVVSSTDLALTLGHEIFHIFLRNNLHLRTKLNALIGFHDLQNASDVPLLEESISNPDVNSPNVYTTVRYENSNYKTLPLLIFEPNPDPHKTRMPENLIFKLWLFSSDPAKGTLVDVNKTDYPTRMKTNTNINFHPEEILAENFALLLVLDFSELPNPVLSQRLLDALR